VGWWGLNDNKLYCLLIEKEKKDVVHRDKTRDINWDLRKEGETHFVKARYLNCAMKEEKNPQTEEGKRRTLQKWRKGETNKEESKTRKSLSRGGAWERPNQIYTRRKDTDMSNGRRTSKVGGFH